MHIWLLCSLLCLVYLGNAPASAAEPPARATTIVVYGDDPCPQEKGDEIVICGRKPETERYRISKDLREKSQKPAERSWVSRWETMEDLTRFSRPNSCSVVGTGGQTGCFDAMIREWRAARRAAQAEEAGLP